MKRLLLALLTIVVALAVARLVSTRSVAKSHPPETSQPSSRSSEVATSQSGSAKAMGATSAAPTLPAAVTPAPVYATPPPEATDAPQRREGQEKLWRDLRKFATDVKLTDDQWNRLVNDLIELATADQEAWLDPSKADLPARHELTVSLERDLEARCASYMTKDQVAELRFRYLSGLISRARQVVVPLPTGPQPTGS